MNYDFDHDIMGRTKSSSQPNNSLAPSMLAYGPNRNVKKEHMGTWAARRQPASVTPPNIRVLGADR
jgi:hypothetical protein